MIIWQLRNEGIYKTHINNCFLSYITSAQLHTSLIVVIIDYCSYKLPRKKINMWVFDGTHWPYLGTSL